MNLTIRIKNSKERGTYYGIYFETEIIHYEFSKKEAEKIIEKINSGLTLYDIFEEKVISVNNKLNNEIERLQGKCDKQENTITILKAKLDKMVSQEPNKTIQNSINEIFNNINISSRLNFSTNNQKKDNFSSQKDKNNSTLVICKDTYKYKYGNWPTNENLGTKYNYCLINHPDYICEENKPNSTTHRSDNRIDEFHGFTKTYRNIKDNHIIRVVLHQSRSGKTKKWKFSVNTKEIGSNFQLEQLLESYIDFIGVRGLRNPYNKS